MLDILYIHPHGHLIDEFVVPSGAITCMNAFAGNKVGIYSCDLTPELVQSARIVALDLYWASSLAAVQEIVSYVKGINPRLSVVLAGYTASFMPCALKHHMNIDRVLTKGEDESQFLEYTNGILGDYNRAVNITALDPLTVNWFQSSERMSAPSIHLSRCCTNPHRMDHSCSMLPACHGASEEGIYTCGEVERLLIACPNKTIFWVTGMSPETIRRQIIDPLRTVQIEDKHINICSCGQLPMEAVEIAKANPNIGWIHIFCYGRPELRSKEVWDEQQVILRAFSQLRSEGHRNFLVLGVLGDVPEKERPPTKKKGELDAMMALNWRILPDLKDDEASFHDVEAFSRATHDMMAMRYLSPGLFLYHHLDHDPLVNIPESLPVPGAEAFLDSILEGLKKWGTLISDEMDYQCIPVKLPTRLKPQLSSILIPMSDIIGNTAVEPMAAEIKVTPKGWRVLPSTRDNARCLPAEPFVILPKQLRHSLGNEMAGNVRVFCAHENSAGQSITFTIEDCRRSMPVVP